MSHHQGSSPATSGRARPSHPAWHAVLLVAGVLAATALGIDPESALDARETGQLRIARVGLWLLVAVAVGVWGLRRMLQEDIETAIDRFRSAPIRIERSQLVSSFEPGGLRKFAWVGAAVWFVAISIGLANGSSWVEYSTIENGIFETITVIAYLAGAYLAARALWPSLRAGFRAGDLRRWFLLAVAGCFLIAAEETDWGQTYLQYASPEAFEHANIQGDLSLHNLALPESFGVTRWANWVLRLMAAALGGVVPLLLFTCAPFRRLVYALDIPLPPWWSQAVLLSAALIPEIEGRFRRDNVDSELREVAVSVAVLVWVACAVRRDEPAAITRRR